ncbi:MAG: bifunctional transaldolase/phosoglucose isomerase [Anaerolineae bacterium]|jgi:transaldolase/glucose-6-phosphate isomerase|nr:bifunctional transaldolase/phosoglucose isomerase [Anaerolineae bacterium]
MSNPPVEVQKFGQSIWIDNIRRKLLEDGTFQRMIDEDGVVGVTSNPSIFQKAIGQSDDYDGAITNLIEFSPEEVYEKLAVGDIQHAADLFRTVYDKTAGRDGYVSLEVSPLLARDTHGTVLEAKRLAKAVNRPNLMIKIPATPEGIPAIEATIAEGISVNVTLIFSVANYVQVAEAYMRGLERRHAEGLPIDKIASVASFFISRIDSMIDKMLENNIHSARMVSDMARVQANSKLLGRAAIANARLAYQRFLTLFNGERFAKLKEAGAQVQRPLWASTSTKNPAYPATLYVDSLIGNHTVNTVPPETLVAFKQGGTVESETILDKSDNPQDLFDQLAEVGIEIDQVTKRLQDDGVEAFVVAFEDLIAQIKSKRSILNTGMMERQKLALGIYANHVKEATTQLSNAFFNSRIWNHDGSLWKDHGPTIAKIQNRLGWLNVLDTMDIDRVKRLQASINGAGFTHVVLLGMGGSSLAPEVMAQTFGIQPNFPELLVIDSTNPAQIKRIEDQIKLDKTLFIVASKSGSTIETACFQKYFYAKTGNKGSQFIAITDEGSALAKEAEANHFRDIFINPSDIGGRYSALSYFGLVPAAIMGLDIDRFWNNARMMIEASGENIPDDQHPGIALGAIMGALGQQGRDKICIFASQSIASFGNWVEQLVAESIGKEGRGVVPVVGATVGRPHDYASDRLFIYLKVLDDKSNEELDEQIKTLREAGHPRVTLLLDDPYAIAGEFFRWEYATAVAGQLYKINPFDELNVTESKENTGRLLAYYQEHGALPKNTPFIEDDQTALYISQNTLAPLRELGEAHGYNINSRLELLAAQFNGTHSGDYFGILAYLPNDPKVHEKLERIRRRLRHATRRAVTLGYGPRYLHSTGQLHKGGANNGVFIQITADHSVDLPIPDMPYTFGILNDAQAAGDIEALEAHGRRVIRVHIKGDILAGIDKLLDAIEFVSERRQ